MQGCHRGFVGSAASRLCKSCHIIFPQPLIEGKTTDASLYYCYFPWWLFCFVSIDCDFSILFLLDRVLDTCHEVSRRTIIPLLPTSSSSSSLLSEKYRLPKKAKMASSLSSLVLLWAFFLGTVLSLEVTPGSSCAAVCLGVDEHNGLDPAASYTNTSEITCKDADYSERGIGIKYKNCMECLQKSEKVNGTESDVHWYLCMCPPILCNHGQGWIG